MKRQSVRTVMSTDVITTTVSTPVKEAARILDEHHISAVPVLDDDGDLVGVVSEGDLMVKLGGGVDRHRPGWFAMPGQRRVAAKVSAAVAGDLMTSPAVTIEPFAALARVARTMVDKKVKRLPVVENDGELVGIVSRADLIQAYLRPDDEIRRDIEENVFGHGLLSPPHSVTIDVTDGVVELHGLLELRSSADIVADMVGAVDGVVDVVNELVYERDDTVRYTSQVPGGADFPRTL